MYIHGEVRYWDIFRKERRYTKFRLLYGGPDEARKVPEKEEWLLHPDCDGNDAT
jgi:hypothetical protein